MELKEFLTIFFERGNAVQIFWNYIIFSLVAIVTISATYPKFFNNIILAIATVVVYIFLAVPNYISIITINRQRQILLQYISESGRAEELYPNAANLAISLAKSGGPDSDLFVAIYHIVIFIFVLIVVWSACVRNNLD